MKWSAEELAILSQCGALSARQVYESRRLPGRTQKSIENARRARKPPAESKVRSWTDAEIAILRECGNMTITAIVASGRLPGRTFCSIRKARRENAPVGRASKRWTPHEIDVVMSCADTAETLFASGRLPGRSEGAIRKAIELFRPKTNPKRLEGTPVEVAAPPMREIGKPFTTRSGVRAVYDKHGTAVPFISAIHGAM